MQIQKQIWLVLEAEAEARLLKKLRSRSRSRLEGKLRSRNRSRLPGLQKPASWSRGVILKVLSRLQVCQAVPVLLSVRSPNFYFYFTYVISYESTTITGGILRMNCCSKSKAPSSFFTLLLVAWFDISTVKMIYKIITKKIKHSFTRNTPGNDDKSGTLRPFLKTLFTLS